jgi:hypothetical protein
VARATRRVRIRSDAGGAGCIGEPLGVPLREISFSLDHERVRAQLPAGIARRGIGA